MAEQIAWRNRIIDTRLVDASELRSHPLNPRRHPDAQIKAVTGLLDTVGIADTLTVYDSPTYGGLTVIDGHLRKDLGGLWPVNVLDVTDDEAALLLSTLDPVTGMAEMDARALAELLGRVELMPIEDEGVQGLLAMLAEQNGLGPQREMVDAEPQIDRAEELRKKWGTATGQLWGLGKHTICPKCGKRHELK